MLQTPLAPRQAPALILLLALAGSPAPAQDGPSSRPAEPTESADPAAPAEGEASEDEALLEELSAKFSKLGAFRSELTYACKELNVSGTMTLSYDPKAERLFILRKEASPQAGESYVFFEPGAACYWDATSAHRFVFDLRAVVTSLHGFDSAITLVRGGKAKTREAFEATLMPQLGVVLGSHEGGTRPTLELGVGLSTRTPNGWISQIRDDSKRKLVASAEEVRAELRGGITIVVDRATGLFRSQRVVVPKGTFTIEATPAKRLEAFPKPRPPEDAVIADLPVAAFVSMLEELSLEAAALAGARLKGVSDAEQVRAVAGAYTKLAASCARARRHHVLRDLTRRYVRHRRQQGLTLAQLKATKEAEAKVLDGHFQKTTASLVGEEAAQLKALRRATLEPLKAGTPLAKAVAQALSPKAVDAARKADESALAHLEAVLKTER